MPPLVESHLQQKAKQMSGVPVLQLEIVQRCMAHRQLSLQIILWLKWVVAKVFYTNSKRTCQKIWAENWDQPLHMWSLSQAISFQILHNRVYQGIKLQLVVSTHSTIPLSQHELLWMSTTLSSAMEVANTCLLGNRYQQEAATLNSWIIHGTIGMMEMIIGWRKKITLHQVLSWGWVNLLSTHSQLDHHHPQWSLLHPLSTRSLCFLSTSCKEVPSWVLTATSILEVCSLCSVMHLGDSSIRASSAPSCSQQTSHMNVLLYPLLDVWFDVWCCIITWWGLIYGFGCHAYCPMYMCVSYYTGHW